MSNNGKLSESHKFENPTTFTTPYQKQKNSHPCLVIRVFLSKWKTQGSKTDLRRKLFEIRN